MGLSGHRFTSRAAPPKRAVIALLGAALTRPALGIGGVSAATTSLGPKGSGNVADALLVQVRRGARRPTQANVVARVRGRELARFEESRVRVASVAPNERDTARRELLTDPRVESVQDDAVTAAALTPTDPYWEQQWNMRRVRATEAWPDDEPDDETDTSSASDPTPDADPTP